MSLLLLLLPPLRAGGSKRSSSSSQQKGDEDEYHMSLSFEGVLGTVPKVQSVRVPFPYRWEVGYETILVLDWVAQLEVHETINGGGGLVPPL